MEEQEVEEYNILIKRIDLKQPMDKQDSKTIRMMYLRIQNLESTLNLVLDHDKASDNVTNLSVMTNATVINILNKRSIIRKTIIDMFK